MGDLRGSLYDLFGYFIPGFFGSIGLWLIIAPFAGAEAGTDLSAINNPILFSVAVIVMYTFGHVLQAVGNALPFGSGIDMDEVLTSGKNGSRELLSVTTLAAINNSLRDHFNVTLAQLPPRDRFALIDEARVLAPREGDREVYIYHHGFYRGMLVASSVLGIGLLVALFTGQICVVGNGLSWCITRGSITLIFAVLVGSTIAFWFRLRRFAEYRLVRAAMLWLIVISSESSGTRRKPQR